MTDDWIEFLAALLDAQARFLVMGAHALAAHGVACGTQDLDVWSDPTPRNADRVWRALAAFGAPAEALQRPCTVVQLGLSPNLGRAEFIANKRATGRLVDLGDLESLGEP